MSWEKRNKSFDMTFEVVLGMQRNYVGIKDIVACSFTQDAYEKVWTFRNSALSELKVVQNGEWNGTIIQKSLLNLTIFYFLIGPQFELHMGEIYQEIFTDLGPQIIETPPVSPRLC